MRNLALTVAFFGIICAAIAGGHVLLGPSVIVGGIPVNATMDSEDRFFGTLFLGFGAALIWCSFDLTSRKRAFAGLLAIFFLGGVARLLSIAVVGWPHPLFAGLCIAELILPTFLWAWYSMAAPP